MLPWLQKLEFWRGFRRPGVGFIVRCNDPIGPCTQQLAQGSHIQSMMSRSEAGQVFFRKPEQTNRWRQASAMFRMKWIFEPLLKMNESTSRLNQTFEIVRIG